MAKKKTAAIAAVSAINTALLAQIIAATNAGSFIYVSDADAAPMLSHVPPLIEQNPLDDARDAHGNRQTRATAEGLAFVPSAPVVAAPPAATAERPAFKMVKGFKLPPRKRGGKAAEERYPFSTMEVDDAIFIPATPELPEPAKSLASTVSSATRRFAVQQGMKTVERAKVDAAGNEVKDGFGNVVKEKVEIPNLVPTRRFSIMALADGKDFEMPGKPGAVIARTA